jgi:hypothetical protein
LIAKEAFVKGALVMSKSGNISVNVILVVNKTRQCPISGTLERIVVSENNPHKFQLLNTPVNLLTYNLLARLLNKW